MRIDAALHLRGRWFIRPLGAFGRPPPSTHPCMTNSWKPYFITALVFAVLGVIGLAYSLMTGLILLVVGIGSALVGMLSRARTRRDGPLETA
jgi:hypothetical protein